MIRRGQPNWVKWGINNCVTDICRGRELLKFYRKAGLVYKSLGTEAPAQLKLDPFNKETRIEENKQAIRLLHKADIFTEAQLTVGLDHETAETLEETFQMAREWQPDLANLAMYSPWPFTPLFQELQDKVEIFGFSKYNFATPTMPPEAITRGELLNGEIKNCRRFHLRRALFHCPWRGTGFRRRYVLGCLKAFLKAGLQRTFYNLGKAGCRRPQSNEKVNFTFDRPRKIAPGRWPVPDAAARWGPQTRRRGGINADAGLTFQSHAQAQEAAGLIGPNVAIKLGQALRDSAGLCESVSSTSGFLRLLTDPPDVMIDGAIPARLFAALWAAAPDRAPGIAHRAGRLTGDYVMANRIPHPARLVLGPLPARLAAPLLLKAIRKHAWTFAGAGQCLVAAGQPAVTTIIDNPLTMSGGVWHVGVFESLFRALISPRARVSHQGKRLNGRPACRVQLDLAPGQQPG